jgi:hypothetical protein
MKPEPKPEPESEILTEHELSELFSSTEKDPFDSLPSRLAWISRKFGLEELRQCLFPDGPPANLKRKLVEAGLQDDYRKEDLLDAAAELTLLGLNKVAAIATEVAALKQSRFDQPPPAWAARGPWWRAHQDSEREKWEEKRASRKNGHAVVSREMFHEKS